MKTKLTQLRIFLFVLFLCCIGKLNFAQTTNNYIANDHLISPTVYEWDVYLQATSTDFILRSIQYAFYINPAFIPAGATVTPSFNGAFSELVTPYSGGNPQLNVSDPTRPCISVPSMTVQGCTGSPGANQTTFSQADGPKRIVRFRLTSTLPFNCVAPNLSMIRPNDFPPAGVLRCAASQWNSTCIPTPIQASGTYSTFRTDLGGPTLVNLINNLNEISVTATSPASAQMLLGQGTATFNVTGTGNGSSQPLSYQWLLNGNPIADGPTFAGTHTNQLTVTNPTGGGTVSCRVTQCSPTTAVVTSAAATLLLLTQLDDNNACTIDTRDSATGIVTHTPVNVNDNNVCTTDACDPATGTISHTAVNANDNNPCTTDGCDAISGVFNTATNFTDANLCDIESCDPATGNISHTPVSITDNNPCTTDACDPSTGIISHTAVSVDDANVCTIDHCDPASGFISHNLLPAIDDGNACTTDNCDPATGSITHDNIPITDNNLCTNDVCDPATGVIHFDAINVDDNNVCTTDACDPSTGIISHLAISTSDNNLCTTDECDPLTGVYHNPVNRNDGDLCTIDLCDPDYGVFHVPVNMNDGNACTIDYCDPRTGSISHPNVITDDNNLCTNDGCDPLTGIYHQAISSNDNNACSIDNCDPILGVLHYFVNIDDNNNCTADICNPQTGIISHINNTPMVSVTADEILCYGGGSCVTVSASGNGSPYSGTGLFCGYPAGTYVFEVTDNNSCMVSTSINISQPAKISFSVNASPESCGMHNGVINFSGTGGIPPYNYYLNGIQTPGNSSSVSGLSSGIFNWAVTDSGGCTSRGNIFLGTSGFSPSLGNISGPDGTCRSQSNVVYSVDTIPGATSYIWTLPVGAIGSSTNNSITLSFTNSFIGGFIYVKAVTACGISTPSSKHILLLTHKPAAPSSILGPTSVCTASSETFCIAAIPGATFYSWSITGNGGPNPLSIISGQGSTCININIPAGYNGNQTIKVKSGNCMGLSPEKSLSIHVKKKPGTPGSVNGPLNVCRTQTATYSVGNVGGATSYTWSVSGGASIVAGQGSNSISINFNTSSGSSAVISLYANNNCGSSGIRNYSVTINSNCRTESESNADLNSASVGSLSAYPNPTSGDLTVYFYAERQCHITITLVDILGNILKRNEESGAKESNYFHLDYSDIAKGIYIMKVDDDAGNSKSLRIILE